MSDSRGSGIPNSFCTNCGTQVRPETQFCVNCGASLLPSQETTESSSMPSGPSVSEQFGSVADSLKEFIQELKVRFSTASSSPAGNTLRGTPSRLLSWFRDIPVGAKFVFVGLISILGLVILALLSPVIRGLAILALLVSVVVLIVRAIQRRSVMKWGVAAVISLVLIPVFGVASNVFYGGSESTDTVAGGINPDPSSGQYSNPGSEAEREYVFRTAEIADETTALMNLQAEYNGCGYSCLTSETATEESEANNERFDDLIDEGYSLTAPAGYEDTHENFVNMLDECCEDLTPTAP